MSDLDLLPTPATPRRTRALIVLGAAAVTGALLAVALFLGDWAFATRSASLHQRRLDRAIEQKARRWQIAQALRTEGMSEVGQAQNADELAPLVDRWGASKRVEILERARASSRTAVFRTDSVAYFLFFDEGDRLRAASFVTR